jgi:hypothetical protein
VFSELAVGVVGLVAFLKRGKLSSRVSCDLPISQPARCSEKRDAFRPRRPLCLPLVVFLIYLPRSVNDPRLASQKGGGGGVYVYLIMP